MYKCTPDNVDSFTDGKRFLYEINFSECRAHEFKGATCGVGTVYPSRKT
jgi:hypothetical protein